MDISKELSNLGFEVEKRLILLSKPIKAVGTFVAKAKLATDVETELTIDVSVDPKQIEENQRKEAALAKDKEVAAAVAAKAKAENGDDSENIAESEMTDEQRLDKQARDLLRS